MKITKTRIRELIREELQNTLSETTPEDERDAFNNMIRETAHQLLSTHTKLSPVQQEAYENLLLQAANSLSDRREERMGIEEEYYHISDATYDDGTVAEDVEFWDDVIEEAEYQGRKVTLNKPMKGDVKKSKVYVKNAKGNVVKVNFGDPNMRIKKSNPKRRKSFRARHNCDNPGPKWKARYWSCKAW
tara:strand:- start:383 stop:946 length:564 start_codon:yes stop_codon:yes gene_type:complete